MEWIDIFIVAVYLIGLLLFGLWFGRFVKTEKDYFLAGRTLPFWAIGMSIVVSDIGAVDFVSLCGSSYRYGIAAANMDWIGTMPAIVLATFIFIPYYWRSGVYSVPEYLGRRFGASVRALQSVAWILFLVVNLGAVFWASAGLFDELLGGRILEAIGFTAAPGDPDGTYHRKLFYVVLTAAFTGLYTISGGLAAVVYTDVVQLIIMFIGAFFVVGLGLAHPDVGGFAGLKESLAAQHPDHLTLFLPHDTATPFPWTGVLFGLALVQAPAYFMANQTIVQRTLGARDEWAAKAGTLFGGVLKFFIPILVVLPGLIALRLVPDLEDADKAYAQLMTILLPAGLRGLVFAAFLAAMMSSVDSILASAATLVTRDCLMAWSHLAPSPRRLLAIGRAVTVLLLVGGIGLAATMETELFAGIYEILQSSLAIIQGPTWALLVMGMFWRRATPMGGLAGLVAGLALSIGLTVWHKAGFEPALFHAEDPFMFIAFDSFSFTLLVIAIASLFTPPVAPEALRGLVFRSYRYDDELQDAIESRQRSDDDSSES